MASLAPLPALGAGADAPSAAAQFAPAPSVAFEIKSRVVSVTGVPTEVICATSSGLEPPKLQVVIFPGNPGSCRFYVAFMEALFSDCFGGRADVLAVSHAGHEQGSAGDRAWTLDCQISHKADFLRQHVLLPGRPPAVLVAHSIGAYMALHALRLVEDERGGAAVAKVILCKPFLRTNPSCYRQAFIRAAAARARMLSAVAGGLGAAAPEALKQRIMRVVAREGQRMGLPALEDHAIPAAAGLLGRGSVLNNLHLAHHEFIDLNRPFDWELLRRLGPRVAVIAAPRDMWFPEAHYEEMLSEVPGVKTHFESDLSHAFCVSLYQSQKVARLILALVEARLAATGAEGAAALGAGGRGSPAGAAELTEEAAVARARL